MSVIARAAVIALALSSAACATAPRPDSGFLSSYEGLQARTDTIRVAVRFRSDDTRLAGVQSVYIEPAVFYPEGRVAVDLSEAERQSVLNEVDRQLCYELSERYSLAAGPDQPGVARVRVAVTGVSATGRAASGVSAAAAWFIPGPIGIRPGGLGALAAEAEMLEGSSQIAALAWARQANAVGTDSPSLSRVGDALQFAELFGDDAAEAMTAQSRGESALPDPDPCARFGPRLRPLGFISSMATGLYVPEASGGGSAPTDRDDD